MPADHDVWAMAAIGKRPIVHRYRSNKVLPFVIHSQASAAGNIGRVTKPRATIGVMLSIDAHLKKFS